jgi:WD40 repeat protein
VNIPASPGITRTAAHQLSFEPTGRFLAASNVDQVAIVDLHSHRVSAVQRLAGTFAKFDAAGSSLIATNTKGLSRFPVRHEQVGETWKTTIDPAQPLLPASPGLLSLSADGNVVAIADRFTKPQVLVHNFAENVTHALQPYHRAARWLSVSADGQLLATSTWHGHDVHIWDIQAAKLVKKLPAQSARVMFRPDGQQLVVNESAQFTVWRVTDWTPLHPPVVKSVAAVPGPIAYSPDSRWLAILDAPSKIRLLDSSSLAELATFKLDSEHFIEEWPKSLTKTPASIWMCTTKR